MKKSTRTIMMALFSIFMTLFGQSLFAADTSNSGSAGSSNTLQILGAVVVVLLALTVPLIRGGHREISHQ